MLYRSAVCFTKYPLELAKSKEIYWLVNDDQPVVEKSYNLTYPAFPYSFYVTKLRSIIPHLKNDSSLSRPLKVCISI